MKEPDQPGRAAEEPFIITAMLSLVFSNVWLATHPALLEGFFYSDELLAITHIVTLGFITSLMMGVLMRLAPMAFGVEPPSRRMGLVQYGLFALGASGMVVHFWRGHWMGLAWATLLVLAAAMVQLINFRGLFAVARRGNWSARYAVVAIVNLVLAASLGVALGAQKALGIGGPLLAVPLLDKLAAHFHLAALGWVTLMIFGVQLKLVPTTRGSGAALAARLVLLEAGLVALVVSLLSGGSWELAAAIPIATAVIWHASGPLAAMRRRKLWLWESAALIALIAIALTGLALAAGLPALGTLLRTRVQLAYGYATLVGWTLVTIMATAFKLFPVWVWKERFEPEWGLKPVPSVTELASPLLTHIAGGSALAGVATAVAGIVFAWPPALRLGLGLVLAGNVAFVANFIRTARWALLPLVWKPPTGRT